MWGCIAGVYPNMYYGSNILSGVQSGIFLCFIIINNLSTKGNTKVYQGSNPNHNTNFSLDLFQISLFVFQAYPCSSSL